MNKYLKVFALSSSVLGAIGITAINPTNETSSDLNNIYDNIEKMQESVPRLSRINYVLDVNPVQAENVEFATIDDAGVESELSNQEVINYLNQTLEETNVEYEQLRQTLIDAIQDTMENLEQYKDGTNELSNEQKIYIKEHANSIKYLAETLEDLSEDVLCCIDGCEDCEDETCFNEATSMYLTTINNLEQRIQTLENALHSLQVINGISSPNFYGYGCYPNFIMYGIHSQIDGSNDIDDTQSEQNEESMESDETISEESNIEDDNQEAINEENTTNDTSSSDGLVEIENDTNSLASVYNTKQSAEEEKPTTFGLKSNIDTYAPTKRNIDTFFNTALANNEYNNMYGGGYGPYGYGFGGGYGYGMPYGHYNNPYGMSGLNSNIINRSVLDSQQPTTPANASLTEVNEQTNNEPNKQSDSTKKFRIKRAKNIDSYAAATVQSNVNTMGESKISNFFKQKFNNLRKKIRNQKDKATDKAEDIIDNVKDVVDDNTSNMPIQNNENVDNNNINNTLDNIQSESNISNDSYLNTSDLESTSDLNLKQENQIHAR